MKSEDIDLELFTSLVSDLPADSDLWVENSMVVRLAQALCRRSAWASRPDVMALTRSMLAELYPRLELMPGLVSFVTVLESRLPATELLSWSTK